jgi:hypothetical protein
VRSNNIIVITTTHGRHPHFIILNITTHGHHRRHHHPPHPEDPRHGVLWLPTRPTSPPSLPFPARLARHGRTTLVLIAVYDVTSVDSWREAVARVEVWRSFEKIHGPRVLVVVGTQLDRLDDGQADRAVPLVSQRGLEAGLCRPGGGGDDHGEYGR